MLHMYLLGLCLYAFNFAWAQVKTFNKSRRGAAKTFNWRFQTFNVRHIDNTIFTKRYSAGTKDLKYVEAKEWRNLMYQLLVCLGLSNDQFLPGDESRKNIQHAVSFLLIYYDLIWDAEGHNEAALAFIDELTPKLLRSYKVAFHGQSLSDFNFLKFHSAHHLTHVIKEFGSLRSVDSSAGMISISFPNLNTHYINQVRGCIAT